MESEDRSPDRGRTTDDRSPLPAASDRGVWISDAAGNRFLDAVGGPFASSLGYAHPAVVEAIQHQSGRRIGNTPLGPDPLNRQAAEEIAARSLGGPVLFTASGTEANEAAIRLARWHGRGQRYKLITFAGSRHGATLGSLTASGDPRLHEHAGPLAAGFTHCPYGDADAVAAAIDDQTAAIFVHPLQTDDAVRLPPEGFLAALRELADQHQLLLMMDETQLPIGLSGQWFAFQSSGVQPDLLTLSAGLAGGLACGAVVLRDDAVGGPSPVAAWPAHDDPLIAAAILATLRTIESQDLLQHARTIAASLVAGLESMRDDFDFVRSICSLGLMIGVELDIDATAIVDGCRRQGLLLGRSGDTTLRLQPPLVTSETDTQSMLQTLRQAVEAVEREPAES